MNSDMGFLLSGEHRVYACSLNSRSMGGADGLTGANNSFFVGCVVEAEALCGVFANVGAQEGNLRYFTTYLGAFAFLRVRYCSIVISAGMSHSTR